MIKLITKGTSFLETYTAIVLNGMEINTNQKFKWIPNYKSDVPMINNDSDEDLYIFMNYSDYDLDWIDKNIAIHKNSLVASDYISSAVNFNLVKTYSQGSSLIDSILSALPLGLSSSISSVSGDIIAKVKNYLTYQYIEMRDIESLMAYCMYLFYREQLLNKYTEVIADCRYNGKPYKLIIDNYAPLYRQMEEAISSVPRVQSRVFTIKNAKASLLLATDNKYINEKAHKMLTNGVDCAIVVVLDTNKSRVSVRTNDKINAVEVAKLFDENAKGKDKASTVFVHFPTFDYETLITLITNYNNK